MNNTRKAFLEKQINHYAVQIDRLEKSTMNRKMKKDLQNMKELYTTYIGEYKSILINNLQ